MRVFFLLLAHERYIMGNSYLEDIISTIGYKPRGGRTQVGGQFKQQQEDLKSQGLSEEVIQVVHKVARANRIDYEVRSVSRWSVWGNLTACSS